MKFNFKRFITINIGLIIMTIGLNFFLIPSNLAVGGVTGLAMVLNNIIPSIPIGVIMLILNAILFILAFILVGKEFGGYTIYCSLGLSGLIYIFETFTPVSGPLVDDLLINLIYGIVIGGIGMAIVFYQNASTGGTDIIAKIFNKYFHIEMGKGLFLADFLIVLFASYSFGLKLGLYALLGIAINTLVIDNLIAGFNKKINLIIISNRSDDINRFILEELNRGTTLYNTVGGFSKEEKTLVNTIVNRKQYIRIKNYVKSVDTKAFISVGFVHEVLGEGFIEY